MIFKYTFSISSLSVSAGVLFFKIIHTFCFVLTISKLILGGDGTSDGGEGLVKRTVLCHFPRPVKDNCISIQVG